LTVGNSKLKELLKMPNLSDRQRRILIAEDVLGIYGVEKISLATGISINHVYSELRKMGKSQVRSTYLVLGDIYNNKPQLDSNETIKVEPQSTKKTNEVKYSDEYLEIYSLWPKKEEKSLGFKAYKKLLKNGHTKLFLLQCVQNYLESGGDNKVKDRDPQYVKGIAKFFNQELFMDYAKSSDPSAPEPKPFIEEDNSISKLLV